MPSSQNHSLLVNTLCILSLLLAVLPQQSRATALWADGRYCYSMFGMDFFTGLCEIHGVYNLKVFDYTYEEFITRNTVRDTVAVADTIYADYPDVPAYFNKSEIVPFKENRGYYTGIAPIQGSWSERDSIVGCSVASFCCLNQYRNTCGIWGNFYRQYAWNTTSYKDDLFVPTPDRITVCRVGEAVFCYAKEMPKLPSTIVSIGKCAFACCEIDTVCISEGVREILHKAFYKAKVKKMILPSTLNYVGASVIVADTTVIYAQEPPYAPVWRDQNNAPKMLQKSQIVIVPDGTRAAYESDLFWGQATIKEMGEEDTAVSRVKSATNKVVKNSNYIEILNSTSSIVNVFSIDGKRVYSGSSNRIGPLQKGVYIVKIGQDRVCKIKI